MTNKWNLRISTPEELRERDELATALPYSAVTCLLLVQRGINSAEAAKSFFKTSVEDLNDPFLMPDMAAAVKRLNKALGEKENILIYGDYDVDGTTAVTLVYKYLRHYSANLDYYIPDRYDEGYGISYKGIDYAVEQGVTLIIVLDCGIKAVEKVAYAKTKGIDFIICDHHMPDKELPAAVAILDAKRTDSHYPYEHLSGCGVGFKFMQAFAGDNGFPNGDAEKLEQLYELTAVSIASDIVPITGENRVLAYYGLRQLNSNPSLGFRGIIKVCGLSIGHISINDLVFKIGPRLNASGRMMNGREAVDLLLAKDVESAREKSKSIDQYNDERRELDKKITDEANAIIDHFTHMEDRKAIVVYDPGWHKGVIGIVASRLAEKYCRPTVVLCKSSSGLVTGSARSVGGFDVYTALESCRDLLDNFGGHTYAAGLSLREENLKIFIERFTAVAAEEIASDQMTPQIDIDMLINLKDVNQQLLDELKKMEPFGPDNQKPVFCSRRVRDFGTSKLVGKESEHIKLDIIDDSTALPVHAIAFGMHAYNDRIHAGLPFDLCYTIEENTYNKRKPCIQLMVKDIRMSEETE
ncbi:MAG: single-stranded-DNA-specific exonuclease RecJ [Tannerella sp.]|jgi:single-stranded-DNA-specific exonuclease|nr:single-stranded-DNA-specific exonuclease RecJ [Tannerella sp.]